jgi:hypothetical protein
MQIAVRWRKRLGRGRGRRRGRAGVAAEVAAVMKTATAVLRAHHQS